MIFASSATLSGEVQVAGGVVISFFVALGSWFSYRASKQAKNTHLEIKTNHGKRAGDYLEMISDTKTALVAHTLNDAEQFDKIVDLITKVAATAEHTARLAARAALDAASERATLHHDLVDAAVAPAPAPKDPA